MFIPETNNLLKRKNNIMSNADYIKSLEYKRINEALEVKGVIMIENENQSLLIENIYGISFLTDFYNSIIHDCYDINLYYWEDIGHRIEIKKEGEMFKIIDLNVKPNKSILLSKIEFNQKMNDILISIYQYSFIAYYPIIDSIDYFKYLEKLATIKFDGFKPIA